MVGIDRILSRYFTEEIKNNLGNDELRKLERSLFLENGMSIKLSMEHFSTFHSKLKKILSRDICQFEKKCLNLLVKVKTDKEHTKLKIINEEIKQKIIEYYGDLESRKILSSLMCQNLTIPEIIKISKVPKTSGYRKIENLILDGFLVESGKVLSKSKKVSKFKCIFKDVKIEIKNKFFEINCVLSPTEFEKSSIIKVIYNL